MNKKKILIVSRSFYPMNSPRSFRTTELVKEFARQGHAVTLLTVKDNNWHVKFEKKYGVTITDFGPLYFPNIAMSDKSKYTDFIVTLIQRGGQLLFEYPDIELMFRLKKALATEYGYDLLISIAVPHPVHWGVAWAWREENPIAKIWAADCGDPYMGFNIDRISKPFYFKYLEKMFCRKADFITVPIEEAKKAYYSEFRHKIKVIPQGFKFDTLNFDQSDYCMNRIPTFAYAGNLLGGGRNPHELLEFLVDIDRDFKFVIYTQKPGPVVPYLENSNGRIEIKDYIPRRQLLRELSKMDFLINLENASDSQVPSKLIDYYLTGRPVFSVPSRGMDSESARRFLNRDYSERFIFKDMDRYRIDNVCKQFLELCK